MTLHLLRGKCCLGFYVKHHDVAVFSVRLCRENALHDIRLCEACHCPAKVFCRTHQSYLCEGCVLTHERIEQMIAGPLPKCEYLSLATVNAMIGEALSPVYKGKA